MDVLHACVLLAVAQEVGQRLAPIGFVGPSAASMSLTGTYRLVMADWVSPLVARHVTLHEIAHMLTGDIDEPTILQFEGPMPEAADIADLFSLVALLDDVEVQQGP